MGEMMDQADVVCGEMMDQADVVCGGDDGSG